MDVLSLLSWLDHSSVVVEPCSVIFTKSFLLRYLSQPIFLCLAICFHLPWQTVSCVLLYIAPFTWVCRHWLPRKGRVGLGSSFHQEQEQEQKKVSLSSLNMCFLIYVSHSLCLWHVEPVLVPVLDEKPCQQLLWDGGERLEKKETNPWTVKIRLNNLSCKNWFRKVSKKNPEYKCDSILLPSNCRSCWVIQHRQYVYCCRETVQPLLVHSAPA